MSVFPRASSHAIPKCYRHLMNKDSEIADFYPEEFKVDLNGHRFAWMGVVLLPFIDRDRLRAAMEPYHNELTEEEKFRNTNQTEKLIFEPSPSLGKIENRNPSFTLPLTHTSHGISGEAKGFEGSPALGEKYPHPISNLCLHPIISNTIIHLLF